MGWLSWVLGGFWFLVGFDWFAGVMVVDSWVCCALVVDLDSFGYWYNIVAGLRFVLSGMFAAFKCGFVVRAWVPYVVGLLVVCWLWYCLCCGLVC